MRTSGFLIFYSSKSLFKVPLANPISFTTVASTQSLVGADGLLLFNNATLLVVAGSQSTVFRLASTDGWATAPPAVSPRAP